MTAVYYIDEGAPEGRPQGNIRVLAYFDGVPDAVQYAMKKMHSMRRSICTYTPPSAHPVIFEYR